MLRLKFGIIGQRNDFRPNGLDVDVWQRQDKAKRFAFPEPHRSRTGEKPVHGEGKGQPIGLDQSVEGCNAVLRHIGCAAAPECPSMVGSEQIAGMKTEHAVTEMRLNEAVIVARRSVLLDDQVADCRTTIPTGLNVRWTEQLPGRAVSYRQRRAAIGGTAVRLLPSMSVRRAPGPARVRAARCDTMPSS